MQDNNKAGKIGCLVFGLAVVGSFLFMYYSIALPVSDGFWDATKMLFKILVIGIPFLLFMILGAPYSLWGFWRR